MKITYKIAALILISVLSLIGISIISSVFKAQEVQYYTLVEELKTAQAHMLNALVYEKSFEKTFTNDEQVYPLLEKATSKLKNINSGLLEDNSHNIDEILGLINVFRESFEKMAKNARLLITKKNILNTLAADYFEQHQEVSNKLTMDISGSIFEEYGGIGLEIYDEVDTVDFDEGQLQELNTASLQVYSSINQIIILVNQDLLLENNVERFDDRYTEIIEKIEVEDINVRNRSELLKGDIYQKLSRQLTLTYAGIKKLVPELKTIYIENQLLSQELQRHQNEIETITGNITTYSENLRYERHQAVARFQLVGQGFIMVLMLGGGLALGRSITKPLSVLARATEAMKPDQLEQLKASRNEAERKLLGGSDELSILMRSFDRMREEILDKIEEIEEKNHSLQRMDRIKDQFLANTSHELRTPLNGIIGLSDSLIDGVAGPLSNEAIDNLSMIVQSGKRLANLVNDILDFSKMKNQDLQLQLRPVDIRSSVTLVLALSHSLVSSKSVRLVNQVPDDLPLIEADENRLEQILMNLIGNAIKFTHEGEVRVSAEVIGASLPGGISEEKGLIRISITDTGIGIPKDKQTRIFESFEQADGSTAREYGGTGLGLSVTQKLVELHQGTIFLESSEGQGSTFHFTLPVMEGADLEIKDQTSTPKEEEKLHLLQVTQANVDNAELKNQESSNQERKIQESGIQKTVLVVDDEPVNVQLLKNHLSMQGYEVLTASNGFQALEILKSQIPDLILLDLMMPRMSGYDVCQKLREDYDMNTLPVIMLTAKNQVEDMIEGFGAGANDYMIKPFHKDELLARVQTHLKIKEAIQAIKETERLQVEIEERQKRAEAQERHKKAFEHKNQQLELANVELEATLNQLQNTQEMLIESEKMASLGNLVAGVAHEVNTPLGIGITGASHGLELLRTLKKQHDASKMSQKAFEDYLQQGEEVGALVMSSLLKAGRQIQSFKQVAVDQTNYDQLKFNLKTNLGDIFNSLHYMLKKCNPEIIIQCDESIELDSYPGAFSQIITNFVANSLLHGFEGRDTGIITIEIILEGEDVIVKYSDDGVGIPKENLKKIFDPFFTTKRAMGGTGLGMHIVFNLVHHQLSGSLECESIIDEGTTFTVRLPRSL